MEPFKEPKEQKKSESSKTISPTLQSPYGASTSKGPSVASITKTPSLKDAKETSSRRSPIKLKPPMLSTTVNSRASTSNTTDATTVASGREFLVVRCLNKPIAMDDEIADKFPSSSKHTRIVKRKVLSKGKVKSNIVLAKPNITSIIKTNPNKSGEVLSTFKAASSDKKLLAVKSNVMKQQLKACFSKTFVKISSRIIRDTANSHKSLLSHNKFSYARNVKRRLGSRKRKRRRVLSYTEEQKSAFLCLFAKSDEKLNGCVNKTLLLNFLTRHPTFLATLLKCIQAANDVDVYRDAVHVLTRIVLMMYPLSKLKRSPINIFKGFINLNMLPESLRSMEVHFKSDRQYISERFGLIYKILQMVYVTSNLSYFTKSYVLINNPTIEYFGKLFCEFRKNERLVGYILTILAFICKSSKNSLLMFSDNFLNCFHETFSRLKDVSLLGAVLVEISRSRQITKSMANNENIVKTVIGLVTYTGKHQFNKSDCFKLLLKLSKNGALLIMSKEELYSKLYTYLTSKRKRIPYEDRMILYTVLNQFFPKTILLIEKLDMDFKLSPKVLAEVKDDDTSEESEQEDVGSKEKLSVQEEHSLDSENSNISDNLKDDEQETNQNAVSSERISVYFNELDMYNKMKCFAIFNVYDKMKYGKKICHANKINNINYLAYPDILPLAPEAEDCKVNLPRLSIDINVPKRRQEAVSHTKLVEQVVYDLDKLHLLNTAPYIPNPSSFVPVNENAIYESNTLTFESRFECGNLRKVVQTGRHEYELILTPDTFTTKGFQWFYFQIGNVSRNVTYTFHIINLTKPKNMYLRGMKPVSFSVIRFMLDKIGWTRAGESITYYGNRYSNFKFNINYQTLSFKIKFPYSNDFVYLAYHYPYTYTRLMTLFSPLTNYTSKTIYLQLQKLCNSVRQNDIPVLTITANNHSNSLKIPIQKRPYIFLTARVHPSESNSSWIMEGIINSLLIQARDPIMDAREYFIFKIIPMLNPEGVIYGNTRRGLTGLDMNRTWTNPSRYSCPEVYYTKRLMTYIKKECKHPIAAFIDIHGHSRQKFFFLYGCNPKSSWNKADHRKGDMKDLLDILPRKIGSYNPHFKLDSCNYGIMKCKEKTGRVVGWREFDIIHSYTLECSFSEGYSNRAINTRMLTDIGGDIITAFAKIASNVFKSKTILNSFSLDFSTTDISIIDKLKNSSQDMGSADINLSRIWKLQYYFPDSKSKDEDQKWAKNKSRTSK